VSIDKDGFALVVARGDGRLGPQLQRSTLTCVGTGTPPVLPRTEVRSGQPVLPPGVKPECRISDDSRGNIIGRGMPIESLAVFLRGVEGRIVIDKTELEGRYDFELSFAPDGPLGATAPDATRSYRSSIVTAVVEQLGLRLEPYKVAEPGIYIEHIERPSPN
jgi:uncharacterized protein (TIGR03435 family)